MMMFSNIVGHDRPLNILKRALSNNRLAHAYLFSGPAGIGKKMTALAVAAGVNCREAEPGCGSCPSCRKTASGGHPDVHLLASNGEEIKIDQVRQVQADLSLKPFEGEKKALIIDGAENMNTASANAFLKTLEEPPGDALIILITGRPQSLLSTIRSRCQEIRFLPLSRRTLAETLIKRRGLSGEDAWFLAALAQGSIGRALEMDIERERAARTEFMELRGRLPQMSAAEILALADGVVKDRERFERLLDTGVEWLRDVMVMRETGDETLLVHKQAGDGYGKWAGRLPMQRLLEEMELFAASRGLLERRISVQLVAENLLIKLGS
jgi:DNA polymerase-3 subunit delta'